MEPFDEKRFELYDGRRILITGGAGFIGSHLAHALVGLGADVVVLDDLSGGHRANVPADARLIEASILDDVALRDAASGVSYVFHEAAMVSVPESVEHPERCVQVNIVGTERILRAAADEGATRVVFAASAAAYGNDPSLPSRETDVPDAWSPYAASKIAGELLLQAYARCYELSTVSLRYFNIFGPRQDPNSPYAAVISTFAELLREKRSPRIFGDGRQTRDFTYIDNVVLANLLAGVCERPLAGEVINIGTGARIDLLEALAQMACVIGFQPEPTFTDPRPGDVRDSTADITRAQELLGYRPIVDFGEGIRRTLEDDPARA